MEKICNYCGEPIYNQVCYNCGYNKIPEFYDSLEDYYFRKPSVVSYEKVRYKNAIDKIDCYMDILKDFFIKNEIKSFIDLGCGPNEFVKILKQKYSGINAIGYDQYLTEKDVKIFDFENEILPIQNKSIDVVLSSHLLEHVEDIHFILDEAFRIGKKVIIVLPNCINFFSLIKALLGKKMGNLVGLPLIKPKDRHKWFFSSNQSDILMGYYASKFNYEYKIIYCAHQRCPKLFTRINPNLFSEEIFYIFEKR
ncbi:MAG TPA: methionine biosynthesis protein MetW [Victivallales bacterium]|nr:methionine biosynthesis protein MetW [Victivallales bacterium]